ncbi:PREDICTED: BTB/POZ domain-containing protein At3g49900 [Nelumbo nucifera]|uniref:BTB/POZ domain-containing protein At3g49900 n=1 Tax=Nelumbo nucifera TaxID=4432 RepID=A0A1U7Z4Z0_NELNU|nr:PREDICTED: BTB/POZ domain-containing protein At3g49900 [Nelumbo nucifera]
MRGWEDLGVVETIYEEEYEDSSNSPSLSPTLTLPPTPLQTRVQTWSLAIGAETDVSIHVQDQLFQLHKDPLTSRSGYLKRHLSGCSEITVSPPLSITAQTFSLVADFCYGSDVVITPFNVAALRIAAELLDMNEENCGDGVNDGNLRQRTEIYFCQAVSANREYATIVLRSCLELLPEAEERGFLVSRCIEALGLMDGVDETNAWIHDLTSLSVGLFQKIVGSMHEKLSLNHDLLYRIVDFYLKENGVKITEEEKSKMCGSVDCNKLSSHLLRHAVQNPRMPLRFIVRAMLVEQLNTRHCVISTATSAINSHQRKVQVKDKNEAVTLGAILQRDAALRQVAQLKESMETTNSRIESLERELMNMKNLLRESENKREALESGRSASFRFNSEKKVGKGERESVSSASFRFGDKGERGGSSSSSSDRSCDENNLRNSKKSLGWRLMNGLKSAFRTSSSTAKPESDGWISSKEDGNCDEDGDEDLVVIKKDRPFHHRRNLSLV